MVNIMIIYSSLLFFFLRSMLNNIVIQIITLVQIVKLYNIDEDIYYNTNYLKKSVFNATYVNF